MKLVQIRFYRNYGQRTDYVVNNVIPTSISMKASKSGRRFVSYDIALSGGDSIHSYHDLDTDTTFSVFPNNF